MWNCHVTINFDTEFPVPSDCFKHGEVACQVVRSHCEVLHCWDDWVTFRVCLLLKITIQSRHHEHSFFKEVTITETANLDAWARIQDCRVVAAICRCVLNCGWVHCNGTVKVEFLLTKRHHEWACTTGGESHSACHRKEPCDMSWGHGFGPCHSGFRHPKHFVHQEHKRECGCEKHHHESGCERHRHHECGCKKRHHEEKEFRCKCECRKRRRHEHCGCHEKRERHHEHCHERKHRHRRREDLSGCDWSGDGSGDWSGDWSGDCSGGERRRRQKRESHFHPVFVHGKHEPSKRFIFG